MAKTGSIVITTIHEPTAAVRKISEIRPDWRFIVVGDTKTPNGWQWPGVTFITVAEQLATMGKFAEQCPTRHYARKNIGYLKAIEEGSEVIAETDDDNIPYQSFLSTVDRYVVARPVLNTGWENIYTHFTTNRIWPRGFPLERVNDSLRNPSILGIPASFDCPIQQFLADGDPDVDAVYRLTVDHPTCFRQNAIVLQPGSYCPFNSQNTIFWPEAYPLLYLPAYVSFRMTDIWRSFVAQRCLYAMGKPIAFREATVFQERNNHSLSSDFQDELPGYLHNQDIVEMLESLALSSDPSQTSNNLCACYELLVSAAIVPAIELDLLSLWVEALSSAQKIAPQPTSTIRSFQPHSYLWNGQSNPLGASLSGLDK